MAIVGALGARQVLRDFGRMVSSFFLGSSEGLENIPLRRVVIAPTMLPLDGPLLHAIRPSRRSAVNSHGQTGGAPFLRHPRALLSDQAARHATASHALKAGE